MNIIFEIPGTFRVTHIPTYQAGPWAGARVHSIPEPFLVQYRGPEMDKCESQQFPDSLFRSLVSLGKDAKGLLPYLDERYKMSKEMQDFIANIPQQVLPV